ncbi:MAG: hypothetical protein BWK76_05505 [Desulfobulbaceae bacterium A2]|nr:MAG: hypothetical protein BWK76_05505 [Desulfobulbaceae bacterium A2]
MIIGVSMRVDIHPARQERRDALDQHWLLLMAACGYTPLLLPNHWPAVHSLLHRLPPDGLLFTGGNSLVSCGGDAPERDAMENNLLQWAMTHRRPVLGVCRGMQLIQRHFQVSLQEVGGHVGHRHRLNVTSGCTFEALLRGLHSVNAYHRFGSYTSAPPLSVLATAEDGVVMAVAHQDLPIYGQMWHSEREQPFQEAELRFIRACLSEPATTARE